MTDRGARPGKTVVFGIILIILAGVWGIFRMLSGGSAEVSGETNAQRVEYIKSFGWEVGSVPSAVEEIRIPSRFDEAYEQYNALQKEQGFDLRKYRAYYVKKYTYKISNYSGADPVVPICANLLVADGKIIGADISSSEANGLVTVLAKR